MASNTTSPARSGAAGFGKDGLLGSDPLTKTAPKTQDIFGDRAWFEAHPHREFRVRRSAPGEWPHAPDLALAYSAVRSFQGWRARLLFGCCAADLCDPREELAAGIWAGVFDGDPEVVSRYADQAIAEEAARVRLQHGRRP